VDGVPFFIINGKITLGGAQPPEAFLEAFKQAVGEKSTSNRRLDPEDAQKVMLAEETGTLSLALHKGDDETITTTGNVTL
jgi:hypothetical protein